MLPSPSVHRSNQALHRANGPLSRCRPRAARAQRGHGSFVNDVGRSFRSSPGIRTSRSAAATSVEARQRHHAPLGWRIHVTVETLNIDAASFRQMEGAYRVRALRAAATGGDYPPHRRRAGQAAQPGHRLRGECFWEEFLGGGAAKTRGFAPGDGWRRSPRFLSRRSV